MAWSFLPSRTPDHSLKPHNIISNQISQQAARCLTRVNRVSMIAKSWGLGLFWIPTESNITKHTKFQKKTNLGSCPEIQDLSSGYPGIRTCAGCPGIQGLSRPVQWLSRETNPFWKILFPFLYRMKRIVYRFYFKICSSECTDSVPKMVDDRLCILPQICTFLSQRGLWTSEIDLLDKTLTQQKKQQTYYTRKHTSLAMTMCRYLKTMTPMLAHCDPARPQVTSNKIIIFWKW